MHPCMLPLWQPRLLTSHMVKSEGPDLVDDRESRDARVQQQLQRLREGRALLHHMQRLHSRALQGVPLPLHGTETSSLVWR